MNPEDINRLYRKLDSVMEKSIMTLLREEDLKVNEINNLRQRIVSNEESIQWDQKYADEHYDGVLSDCMENDLSRYRSEIATVSEEMTIKQAELGTIRSEIRKKLGILGWN